MLGQRNLLGCTVNLAVGREHIDRSVVAASFPQFVLVAGSGPAGLEAASLAASRGHRVVVHEAGPAPGGMVAWLDRHRGAMTSAPSVIGSVLVCEPASDWVGTSITFDLEPVDAGTELRFQHHGLNPGLECFGTCQAGWTHFLASLVDYVDRGAGSPNPPADVERFSAWRAEHAAT